VRALRRDDADFPRELMLVERPPDVLFAVGDLALLQRPMVAVIGSRNPTPYGIAVAYRAAGDLARAGAVVVSGMAMGLDARAHRGALDAGGGTIAVLGTGIDIDYPPSNRTLLQDVRDKGLVVTEHQPGDGARPWHFPARNRLIAGLARCLLVVEGKPDGGTSNTAEWALKMHKPIWAVPGRLGDPQADGPNRLLQSSAHVYLEPDGMLRELGLAVPLRRPDRLKRLKREASRARAELTGAEATLYDLITPQPAHVDTLAVRSAIEPGLLLAALSSLELQGLVTQLPGKHFALAS
jgi:DNA processing protein